LIAGLGTLSLGWIGTTGNAWEVPSVPFYADKENLLRYLDAAGTEHEIRTVEDWLKRRAHILANFEQVAGMLPDDARRVPLDVRIDREELIAEGNYLRQHLTFAAEAGDRVPAYLLLPQGKSGRRPAVLCLHQTIRVGKDEPTGLNQSEKPYGAELAARGYVVLAVDYPNFGESTCDPYALGYASATMKGIWNHRAAVDLLCSLDQVDPDRLGVMGHSLGGHNSIFAALFDSRLRAVVSSCGFNSFPHYYGGNLTGWSHAGYMPRIKDRYACDPRQMPFDFTELVAALAPRAFLAIAPQHDENFAMEGVTACLEAARPVYALYGVPARLKGIHPDCGHVFEPAQRAIAYEWFERWLGEGEVERTSSR
jgi:dienelactone hydrolase